MAVDVLDQMSRCYSVKAGSRRWPIHVFYKVMDMAFINSWIIYKHVCNSSISRRMFIQRVSKELTGDTPNERLQTESNAAVARCAPIPKKRKTCSDKDCRNRTTDIVMQEASDALSKLQTVTLFRPIRSLQCSWSPTALKNNRCLRDLQKTVCGICQTKQCKTCTS